MSAMPEFPERVRFWPYVQTEGFSLESVQAYGDARATHARKQALEEAVEQADEWSSYVIEDNAPESLRTRMERLK